MILKWKLRYHQMALIGVKGRIETSTYEKDGEKKYTTNVIAERITFLSSNKNSESKTIENEEE